MQILKVTLIYTFLFNSSPSAFGQVTIGNTNYQADQVEVDQRTQGHTNETTQAVGDQQRVNQVNANTRAQNIQGGGNGLGRSLIVAGVGSVAAAAVMVGFARTVGGQAVVEKGISTNCFGAMNHACGIAFAKKAAISFAVAGGMMAMATLSARQGRANYDAAAQSFETAATSSWCGRVDCPDYNPNYPAPGNPSFPEWNYPGGNPEIGRNPSGNPGGGLGGGGEGPTIDTNGDGVPDAYSPAQMRVRSEIKSMIARELQKANALISELGKKGYKMSADGKTLITPKGPISAESMSSAEGMKTAGFSDEAIKEIEGQLRQANEEAAKVVSNREAELGNITGEDGSGGSSVAGMDTNTPGFDPSKYLRALNLNGDAPGIVRAPAGLAIQLSSGESIGAKNDNIFAMVQRAYRMQQRAGRLGNLRQPAQQRTGSAGPSAPMGF